MNALEIIGQLDATKALHDYWKSSSPEAHIIVGGAGAGGWLAHVDWAAAFSLVALAIMIIGGSLIQLFKQYRICLIELREAQRLSDDRVETQRRVNDATVPATMPPAAARP